MKTTIATIAAMFIASSLSAQGGRDSAGDDARFIMERNHYYRVHETERGVVTERTNPNGERSTAYEGGRTLQDVMKELREKYQAREISPEQYDRAREAQYQEQRRMEERYNSAGDHGR